MHDRYSRYLKECRDYGAVLQEFGSDSPEAAARRRFLETQVAHEPVPYGVSHHELEFDLERVDWGYEYSFERIWGEPFKAAVAATACGLGFGVLSVAIAIHESGHLLAWMTSSAVAIMTTGVATLITKERRNDVDRWKDVLDLSRFRIW